MQLSVRSGQRTSGGANPGSPAGMKGNSGMELRTWTEPIHCTGSFSLLAIGVINRWK